MRFAMMHEYCFQNLQREAPRLRLLRLPRTCYVQGLNTVLFQESHQFRRGLLAVTSARQVQAGLALAMRKLDGLL